jgi:anti-sigma factor RsiW
MRAAIPVTEPEIHAFVDGQLSPERAAEVAHALAADPGLAETVAAYRQQNQMLRAAFGSVADEAVPAHLREFATSAPEPEVLPAAAAEPSVAQAPAGGAVTSLAAAGTASARARAGAWWSWAAAASLLVGLGLGATGGWVGRTQVLERAGTPLSFPVEAAVIHAIYSREQRHPVEVWAAEEEHLVAWLSKRLGEPLKAPKLQDLGYSLVGGRLVTGNRQPAAMFMYQNAEGQRITLVARRDVEKHDETAFSYAVDGGIGTFYWVDDDCVYAISGEIDKPRLLAVARAVYGQIGHGSAAR